MSIKDHHHPDHVHEHHECRLISPQDGLGSPFQSLFNVLILLTAVLTFVLNLLVILILVTHFQTSRKKLRQNRKNRKPNDHEQLSMSNTHISFISLSTSVILYSSICVPALYFHTIDDDLPDRNRPSLTKFLVMFTFYCAPIASSLVHLFMSLDRYLAIEYLMNPKDFWYKRNYGFCLTIVWLVSALLVIPMIWYGRYTHRVKVALTITRLMLSFTIPSLISLALYLRIAFVLVYWTRRQSLTPDIPAISNLNQQTMNQNRSVAVKILFLAIANFVCWFPFSVVESMNDLFPDLFHRCDTDIHKHIYYRTMATLIFLTSLSGVAYPILYCFVSKQFQKIVHSLLDNLFHREKPGGKSKQSLNRASSETRTNTTELLPRTKLFTNV